MFMSWHNLLSRELWYAYDAQAFSFTGEPVAACRRPANSRTQEKTAKGIAGRCKPQLIVQLTTTDL